ncbi:hypothetical protein SAMN02982929_00796 [Saccharopolyspora kobensis]|uniref:Recombinase domain-containing protein n=1 Tax=Saccharopolyspora kobensis TaxID=146035 RepID=A0A1H5V844_9PSEU|nr:hypothetical protein SAMN02982929_00796 [Saccharopolyspora kobensis]SFC64074.1 hypothetical protein SAMN05216506_1011274 [Saccharopolyspora kobensis]
MVCGSRSTGGCPPADSRTRRPRARGSGQCRRSWSRASVRSWSTQTRLEGRFLGGRPPYGYRLADAGPHPNTTHAQWGRRVHVLEPDPATAPWVRWMFTERARGRSVASLARELNYRGVPCPAEADQARSPHRSAGRWIARTIALNPGEAALHRPASLEPAHHQRPRHRGTRWRPRLRTSAPKLCARLGSLRTPVPCSVGRRGHIHFRSRDTSCAANCGRPGAGVRVGRDGGVR